MSTRTEDATKAKTRQKRVLLFTTPTCSWCRRAKQYFRQQGVRFKEIDVSRDPSAARDMERMSGQMGVPVIKIGSKVIVGFDQAQIDSLLGLR